MQSTKKITQPILKNDEYKHLIKKDSQRKTAHRDLSYELDL